MLLIGVGDSYGSRSARILEKLFVLKLLLNTYIAWEGWDTETHIFLCVKRTKCLL